MNPVIRLAVAPIAALLFSIGSSAIVSAQTMRAHFLDVGQGSAAVLEFPVEELANVPGIGDGTIKMLRDLVRTG